VLTRGGSTGGLQPGLGQLHEIHYTPPAVNGAIYGHVVNDANRDKLWDAGDTRLSGWTVYIDSNNNGRFDAGERHATTDVSGTFWIGGLAPGTYVVRLVAPSGWSASSPASGSFTLKVISGKTFYPVFLEKKG
jgi:hypothetical protein